MLTSGTRIVLAAAAMAAVVYTIASAQTSEPATANVPAAGDNANPVQAASGPEGNTSAETNPPAWSAIASEVGAKNQRLINELRSELLDDRADYIDRWLSVIGIVLTFFGVVIAIAGIWAFGRFRKIEAEAKNTLGEIKKTRDKSLDIYQDLTAEMASKNPVEANQAVKDTRENPEASLTDKTIADAVSLQQQGKRDDAIEKWRALARVAEGSDNDLAARAWFSIGYLALDEDLKGSVLANDRAIRLKPDLDGAYINRGNAKQKLEQYEAAVADYDEAIRLNPGLAEAYINRSAAKQQLGQYEAAVADCNEAIRLKPDLDGAYINRGNAKQKLEQYEDALADYDEAIRLNPDHTEAYINRSAAKQKLGQYEAAIADCNEAIRLNPDYAVAHNNRGAAKYELGRYEDAKADYDEAIRLNPDYAEAYSNRGEVNQKLGQYEDAVDNCDEAIRLKPDHAEAYSNRGAAKAALDLKDEARKDFEIALELARKANDAKIVAQAEQELRDLDDDAGS